MTLTPACSAPPRRGAAALVALLCALALSALPAATAREGQATWYPSIYQ